VEGVRAVTIGICKLECSWNVAVLDSSLSLDLVITSSILCLSSNGGATVPVPKDGVNILGKYLKVYLFNIFNGSTR
jgi:hypothetical protein